MTVCQRPVLNVDTYSAWCAWSYDMNSALPPRFPMTAAIPAGGPVIDCHVVGSDCVAVQYVPSFFAATRLVPVGTSRSVWGEPATRAKELVSSGGLWSNPGPA